MTWGYSINLFGLKRILILQAQLFLGTLQHHFFFVFSFCRFAFVVLFWERHTFIQEIFSYFFHSVIIIVPVTIPLSLI